MQQGRFTSELGYPPMVPLDKALADTSGLNPLSEPAVLWRLRHLASAHPIEPHQGYVLKLQLWTGQCALRFGGSL